jgi:bifunctional DNA-binding transcriptional regulator/antitoxin component of YhaV-PrlF toxin-antitoxin module
MEPLFIQRTSKIVRSVSKSGSIRTTIPNQVVDFLKVAPGDKLEWIVKIQDAKVVVFVRKQVTDVAVAPSS